MAYQSRFGLPAALIAALCLFTSVAWAQSAPEQSERFKWRIARSTIQIDGTGDWFCEPENAGDYYGLGVRLGIYFSWFTAYIANNFVPSESRGAQDQAAIFLCATLVSLLRSTITNESTKIDCLILVHLAVGTAFPCLSVWGYRTRSYVDEGPVKGIRTYGGFGTHFRMLLNLIVCMFSMWFWGYAIRSNFVLQDEDQGKCSEPFTFMFAKVAAGGPVRFFNLIVAAWGTLVYTIMLFASLLALYSRTRLIARMNSLEKLRLHSHMVFVTGFNQRELVAIFKFNRIFSLLAILFSMVMVECTLNFNRVPSVLGPSGGLFYPSQLIPAIVGTFSFIRILFQWYEEWRDPRLDLFSVEGKAAFAISSPKIDSKYQSLKVVVPTTTEEVEVSEERPRELPFIAERMKGQPIWRRMLTAYLPWLSLIDSWCPRRQRHDTDISSLSGTQGATPLTPMMKDASNSGSRSFTQLPGSSSPRLTYQELENGEDTSYNPRPTPAILSNAEKTPRSYAKEI